MGLADRFRQELEKHNITEDPKSKFEKRVGVSNSINRSSQEISQIIQNLRTKTLDKINKTPCWHDYTNVAKKNMIARYLENKIKAKSLTLSNEDKDNFVNGVMSVAS